MATIKKTVIQPPGEMGGEFMRHMATALNRWTEEIDKVVDDELDRLEGALGANRIPRIGRSHALSPTARANRFRSCNQAAASCCASWPPASRFTSSPAALTTRISTTS